MILLQDNREQSPLMFNKPYIEMVVPCTLAYGDYGCVFNDETWAPVFFERKGLGDLFGTLTSGYDRFKKEINRSIEANHKLVIIIEVTFSDVLKGYSHSKVKGESIARTLFTLMTKHHIPFVCCSSRREMANYISEFYYSLERNRG